MRDRDEPTLMGTNPAAPPKLAALVSRWGQLPSQITVSALEQQPKMEQAIPQLRQEVLSAQSAHIDGVSGASFTSQAYVQSLQSALDQLGRA